MKKLISALMVLVLCLGLSVGALAEPSQPTYDPAEGGSLAIPDLHLYDGYVTGVTFEGTALAEGTDYSISYSGGTITLKNAVVAGYAPGCYALECANGPDNRIGCSVFITDGSVGLTDPGGNPAFNNTQGQDLVVSLPFDYIDRVTVRDDTLPSSNYSLDYHNDILTLSADYLATLSAGNYGLSVHFHNGGIHGIGFVVLGSQQGGPNDGPNGGHDDGPHGGHDDGPNGGPQGGNNEGGWWPGQSGAIIQGPDVTYYKKSGGDMSITSGFSGTPKSVAYYNPSIGSKALAAGDYIIGTGSITVKEAAMANIAPGNYTLDMLMDNGGECSIPFTVVDAPAPAPGNGPGSTGSGETSGEPDGSPIPAYYELAKGGDYVTNNFDVRDSSVTSVTIDGKALTGADYKINDKYLSVLEAYMMKLTAGVHTFECKTANGNSYGGAFTVLGKDTVADPATKATVQNADGSVWALDVELVVVSATVSDQSAVLKSLGAGKMTAFDITLEKAGVKVQPDGTVTVSFPVPGGYVAGQCAVYRQEANGSFTDMKATVAGGKLVFKTDHFSTYIIAEKTAAAGTTGGTEPSSKPAPKPDGSPDTGVGPVSGLVVLALGLTAVSGLCFAKARRKEN